jgi:lipase
MTSSETPREHRIRVNGVELAYFEWGRPSPDGEPTLLLAHATGFHARCWDEVIRRLGPRHVVATEHRGHGRSEKVGITHWKAFGEDLAAIVRELDLRRLLGVGHSMGGHAMVDAAAACPDRFLRLVLIDPVIAPPHAYDRGGWTLVDHDPRHHPTSKRKSRFDSPAAMIARFRDRVPYKVFHPAALRDYCEHGLLPAPDGDGYVLACPPEIEASVYVTFRTNADVYASIRAIDIPVLILRAKEPPADREVMDFSSSPTWPALVGEFRHGREIHYADRTHFLPMEIPGEIAEQIRGQSPYSEK